MNDKHFEAMREATDIVERNLGGKYETWLEWPGYIAINVADDKQLMFGTVNETINADLLYLDEEGTWQFDEEGCDLEYLTTKVDSNSEDAQEIAFAVAYATSRYLEQFPHGPTAKPAPKVTLPTFLEVLPDGSLLIDPMDMLDGIAYGPIVWNGGSLEVERAQDGTLQVRSLAR